MQRYVSALILPLLVMTVLTRSWLMRRHGAQAMHFGKIDKKDFLIPPFALLYFYIVFAAAFDWPSPSKRVLFASDVISWAGVVLCIAGYSIFLMSLVAFGDSFRVGIDTGTPDRLVTSGLFRFTRNPIYVAFWVVLLGEFFVFPSWVLLFYLAAASGLFHRQVLREEAYLKEHYGTEYTEYCARVRRYV
jgi:protein-S-isoprenylcysteine O-methyltransferase Ste14